MKKNKSKLLIYASSIFFLPSFFNSSTPSNSPEIVNHQYQPQGINFSSWKAPTPDIRGVVSYKYLSDEELSAYYQSLAVKIPQPSDQQLNSWFEQYAREYQVSKDLLQSIAYCESHYNTNATNNLYWGMFQYSAGTWASTRLAMGLDPNPELRLNPEESIKTSAFKIASGGIGAWPNCGKITI